MRGGRSYDEDAGLRNDRHETASTERDFIVSASAFDVRDGPKRLGVVICAAVRADAIVVVRRAMTDVRAFDPRELRPHRQHAATREAHDEHDEDESAKERHHDGRHDSSARRVPRHHRSV